MSVDATRRATTLTQAVAAEIRAVMGRNAVRQAELARRLGTNDTWLSVRLRGVQPIDLNDLQRIADALNVAPADLLPSKLSAGHGRVTGEYLPRGPRTPVGKITGHAARRPTGQREPRRPVLVGGPISD